MERTSVYLPGFILVLLALSACQVPPPGAPAAAPPFGQPLTPIQTHGIAGPATYVAPLPTAFILLKPNQPLNNAFCEAWITSTPTTAQVLSAAPVRPNIVETDWLITSQKPNPSDISTCGGLISNYDWPRENAYFQALSSVSISQNSYNPATGKNAPLNTAGLGPFVVIVIPGVDTPGGTVVVDGSSISDMATFVRTYQAKIDQITEQPRRAGGSSICANTTSCSTGYPAKSR